MNLWKKLFPRKMTSEIGSEKTKGNEMTYENKASAIWHDVFAPYTNDELWTHSIAFRGITFQVLEDRLAASFRKMSDGKLQSKKVDLQADRALNSHWLDVAKDGYFIYGIDTTTERIDKYADAIARADFELKLVEAEQEYRKSPFVTLPAGYQPNLSRGGYTGPVLGGSTAGGGWGKRTTSGDLRDVRFHNHNKRLYDLEDRMEALEGKQVGASDEARENLESKIRGLEVSNKRLSKKNEDLKADSELRDRRALVGEEYQATLKRRISELEVSNKRLGKENEWLKSIPGRTDMQLLSDKLYKNRLKARISKLESELAEKSKDPSVPLSAIRAFLDDREPKVSARPYWIISVEARIEERDSIREFLDRYDS